MIGFWETLNDVYNQTNGEYGNKNDIHWSEKMDISFFEVIKNYFMLG